MSIPSSHVTVIASGRTELGLVPALKTSYSLPPSSRSKRSAIWLRAELPVRRTRIRMFVALPLGPFLLQPADTVNLALNHFLLECCERQRQK